MRMFCIPQFTGNQSCIIHTQKHGDATKFISIFFTWSISLLEGSDHVHSFGVCSELQRA